MASSAPAATATDVVVDPRVVVASALVGTAVVVESAESFDEQPTSNTVTRGSWMRAFWSWRTDAPTITPPSPSQEAAGL